MDKINLSICTLFPNTKLPLDDPRWKAHTANFKPYEVTPEELLKAIRKGFAFAPVMKGNYRKGKNFISAQHLGVDYDTGDEDSTIEKLANDPFIAQYASFLYTTISHTEENPHARVVYILDQPVHDPKTYKAYLALFKEKFSQSDPKALEIARFFYGSKGCEVKVLGNILPISVLDEMLAEKSKKRVRKNKPFDLPEIITEGDRNNIIFRYASSMQARGVSDTEIRIHAHEANERNVVPPLSEKEVDHIVDSALGYPKGGHSEVDENLTDYGNAQRFTRLYADRIRYCEELKRPWLVWNGKYWAPTFERQVATYAIEIIKELYSSASKTDGKDERNAIAGAAARLESAYGVQGMLYWAKGLMMVGQGELDNDQELVNLSNGILNMRTNELMPHDPSLYLTRLIPFNYVPDAQCPKWEEFLDFVMDGDKDTIKWLQKVLGWTLAGRSDGRVFPFLYGDGGNGKSTFKETLLAIFGEYARTIPVETVLAHRNAREAEAPMAFLRSLAGARLVFTSELPEGRSLASEVMKDLTGGDTLKYRGPHELQPFSFEPTHVLWVYGNNKPKVMEDTEGVWDRIKLVAFLKRIPDSMRRPMMEVKAEFMAEAEGIIAWMVKGYQLALTEGLVASPAVAMASREYRGEEDHLQNFIDENMVTGIDLRVDKSDFREELNRWFIKSGLGFCPSTTTITQSMGKKGFKLDAGKRHYMGLGPKVAEIPFDGDFFDQEK